MLLWRVFPFREDARSASEPGHPLYLNPRQGTGRWDNPHLTALMYLAEQPSGAVGEAFANLTSWSPRMFSFPMIPGAVRRLSEHGLARSEVGVEAAVCQAGVLHDVGDARAVVATAPDGTRGGLDDAVMRGFLGPTGGSFHMTCIILHSGAQRKRHSATGC